MIASITFSECGQNKVFCSGDHIGDIEYACELFSFVASNHIDRLFDGDLRKIADRVTELNKTIKEYEDTMITFNKTEHGEEIVHNGRLVGFIDNAGKSRLYDSAEGVPIEDFKPLIDKLNSIHGES